MIWDEPYVDVNPRIGIQFEEIIWTPLSEKYIAVFVLFFGDETHLLFGITPGGDREVVWDASLEYGENATIILANPGSALASNHLTLAVDHTGSNDSAIPYLSFDLETRTYQVLCASYGFGLLVNYIDDTPYIYVPVDDTTLRLISLVSGNYADYPNLPANTTLYEIRFENVPPTPTAGADQTLSADASGNALVTLDGSASTDPDGTIVSYVWTDSGGVEIATGATAQVTLPVGEHTITLTVTDDDGASATDTVNYMVDHFVPELILPHRISHCYSNNWDKSQKVNHEKIAHLGLCHTYIDSGLFV